MDDPQLLILAGPPGAGKTTVARLIADRFPRSACIEADWFWTTIVRGFIAPWEKESDAQNRAVIRSVAAAAARLTAGGYVTVVEGIVGPWYLDLVADEVSQFPVASSYLVLRPDLDTCLERATGRVGDERVPGHPALTDEGPIRHMWDRFADLGPYERHVLDPTDLTAAETVDAVWERLAGGTARLDIR